jgi:hypothetical protein
MARGECLAIATGAQEPRLDELIHGVFDAVPADVLADHFAIQLSQLVDGAVPTAFTDAGLLAKNSMDRLAHV